MLVVSRDSTILHLLLYRHESQKIVGAVASKLLNGEVSPLSCEISINLAMQVTTEWFTGLAYHFRQSKHILLYRLPHSHVQNLQVYANQAMIQKFIRSVCGCAFMRPKKKTDRNY